MSNPRKAFEEAVRISMKRQAGSKFEAAAKNFENWCEGAIDQVEGNWTPIGRTVEDTEDEMMSYLRILLDGIGELLSDLHVAKQRKDVDTQYDVKAIASKIESASAWVRK